MLEAGGKVRILPGSFDLTMEDMKAQRMKLFNWIKRKPNTVKNSDTTFLSDKDIYVHLGVSYPTIELIVNAIVERIRPWSGAEFVRVSSVEPMHVDWIDRNGVEYRWQLRLSSPGYGARIREFDSESKKFIETNSTRSKTARLLGFNRDDDGNVIATKAS